MGANHVFAVTLRNSSPEMHRDVSRSSGADLAALMREAAEIAMTDHILKCLLTEDACVSQSHIDRAFGKILPSVSEKVIVLRVDVQRILQQNLSLGSPSVRRTPTAMPSPTIDPAQMCFLFSFLYKQEEKIDMQLTHKRRVREEKCASQDASNSREKKMNERRRRR